MGGQWGLLLSEHPLNRKYTLPAAPGWACGGDDLRHLTPLS